MAQRKVWACGKLVGLATSNSGIAAYLRAGTNLELLERGEDQEDVVLDLELLEGAD